MLRQALLSLSRSRWVKQFVLGFPLSRRVSRRFVAGETLASALEVAARLRAQGLQATMDLLGENVSDLDAARAATRAYLDVIDAIRDWGADGYVSLKLTQLGLDLGPEVALENLLTVLERASQNDCFVRIDMEGSEYTQRTLEIFEQARARYRNVGIVIQAYLHRSRADIERINELGGRVRLCKGAYCEPATIAYQHRTEVSASYLDLMRELMLRGHHPSLASHDEECISAALRLAAEYGLGPDRFEFQMLYGIRRDRQLELARQGYQVRVYIPFGSEWYPYLMRRLAERPANLVFFLTALFRG